MKKKKWLAAFALVAVFSSGAAWWSGREQYKRFVSPPLKNGSRYTFLYPARMTAASSGAHYVHFLDASPPPLLDRILTQLELSPNIRIWGKRRGEIYASWTSWNREWQSFSRPRQVTRRAANCYTEIYDAPLRTGFQLRHYDHTEQPQRSSREFDVVSDSLQVLAPGAPVPSP